MIIRYYNALKLVEPMTRLLFIPLLFSFLAACSSQPKLDIDINPNTNFEKLTSYQFSPETKITVDSNPIMIHRIQTAIDQVLISKGLTKQEFSDKNSADITIQVNFSEHEKQNNSSFNVGLGTSRMGGNSRSSIGVNTNIPMNSNPDIVTKITIDMRDANEAIWHGSDKFQTGTDLSLEETNAAVNEIVNRLLLNFPPENINAK